MQSLDYPARTAALTLIVGVWAQDGARTEQRDGSEAAKEAGCGFDQDDCPGGSL